MIDTGSNLTHPKFLDRGNSIDALVTASRQHGLRSVITIGTNIEESEASLRLARQYPGFVYATAGVHPHDAKDMNDKNWATLEKLICEPEIVAIGEMGLDFCRNISPEETQISVFEQQLAVNKAVGKPVYLHERDAFKTQTEVLKANRSCFSTGVAHCFTGNIKAMRTYLSMDLYIGITGWICDERRGGDVVEAVKYIPQDRLLVETDSPFLLPRTLRPKPRDGINRPQYLREIIAKIALCRNESPGYVADYTTMNAIRLFQLPGLSA